MAYENRNLDGGVMKITVQDGDEAAMDFFVHKALLKAKSPYFNALLGFKEYIENSIKFVNMDIDGFRYVLQWLYKDTIELLYYSVETMIRAYAIADRLMIRALRNKIVDNMRAYYESYGIDVDALRTIQDLEYGPSDNLARLLIDVMAYEAAINTRDSTLDVYTDEDVKQFMKEGGDIAFAVMEQSMANLRRVINYMRGEEGDLMDPAKLTGCCYHDHAEDEGC
ncbi:Transmembrane emp24 domain-containing protein 10 [Neophaeococcomyces mojaviensis]|uniref:Transmembrane emp24 domain-containing protein 10 n=1 Tax=Neophaeococcomyces mojaviensis TaxID=3383035 RepID=A0ACC3A916_9EURO|nr:Transmembrane emp24 domain-containing protein 10 [Knufia sp. JES_112]